MVLFGQLVIGPPGCGKTTYCYAMKMFMESIGRKCEIVNLDFANDNLPYEPIVDVKDFITVEKAMEEYNLGPNGGLLFCMDYLAENITWLLEKLCDISSSQHGCNYILFDCPGQIELYTHNVNVKHIVDTIINEIDARLCSVHLVDAYYCCIPTTFISAVLLVAATMYRLGIPHISVLSKIDLLSRSYKETMPFNLDFFTELTDLTPLLRYLDAPVYDIAGSMKGDDEPDDDARESGKLIAETSKTIGKLRLQQRKMSESICELITDIGLVSFLPMNVEDGETMRRVLMNVDKANGYSFLEAELKQYTEGGHLQQQQQKFLNSVVQEDVELTYMRSINIIERYNGEYSEDELSDNDL